ncbi:MAG: uroporphyrinogen-III decarboxylase-like protein [Lentisphaerae bacterium]|nr:uroporphyrinogen-III decarboxylase-like protein [Lentisphaerota bacterium]
MTKREVIQAVFEGRKPPYVPWHFSFTREAAEALAGHFGSKDLDSLLDNHMLWLGAGDALFEDIGNGRVRDAFGVTWNRSVDRDIGAVEGCALAEPTLKGYSFPDPRDPRVFAGARGRMLAHPDRFSVFAVGFSLFERAWTLRGMESLLMDFYDHPGFVRELLDAIADHNIEQVREAARLGVDCVHFGDDWGQQRGLIMGVAAWREFIKPRLKRMFNAAREAGKFVSLHSCGDVDELFDDLVGIGLNCFNPFQPEVMDVDQLFARYRGRLAFFGGLSTQKTLPYGTPAQVRAEARKLLRLGAGGGYVFAPAHSVEGDVPLANMLAFIEEAKNQPAWKN